MEIKPCYQFRQAFHIWIRWSTARSLFFSTVLPHFLMQNEMHCVASYLGLFLFSFLANLFDIWTNKFSKGWTTTSLKNTISKVAGQIDITRVSPTVKQVPELAWLSNSMVNLCWKDIKFLYHTILFLNL